ncbi:MAG TPA: bifunctional phosphopantothenoylcysteine decarboxylase/phosphopantothenate--cysteine ligase CoaBC [bacterium]|nr:bifunctional phosphopantothenoylcysteine decarboxylase/phosphopantothenate--cysteine ligase CoaBC [bacterium]
MNLKSKKILLGVTGGIAAYKTAIVVRLLKKAGAEVRVVLTRSAEEFITPLTLAALSEHPVGTDLFEPAARHEIQHIHWAEWADLALIAPATANIIGKAANGIADDLLSSLILALQCPVVFAPAMHHQMWSHPAVQRNMEILRGYGYRIIEPGEGDLASGDVGIGRMREPEEMVAFLKAL